MTSPSNPNPNDLIFMLNSSKMNTEIERLLARVDHTKFSTYKAFMRALILEAISSSNTTFDDFNCNLFRLNRDIYDELSETALVYFNMHAK